MSSEFDMMANRHLPGQAFRRHEAGMEVGGDDEILFEGRLVSCGWCGKTTREPVLCVPCAEKLERDPGLYFQPRGKRL